MAFSQDRLLRVAAINFLNPAPLMWDFEHPPLQAELARRYLIERMAPSQCAARLTSRAADIGLIPIAALATMPELRVMPGCVIGSKGHIRSLLLVRRANQKLTDIRTVAEDTASRTTVTYTRILFKKWGNKQTRFVPMAADLDTMLNHADAAVLIGDPALLARQSGADRLLHTGEELVYHDLAEEWKALTGLPFISAVWATTCDEATIEHIASDFIRSRDHGMKNTEALVAEWSGRLPIGPEIIHSYLTSNIHYVLDEECIKGAQSFFRAAAEEGVLPEYRFMVSPADHY